VEPYHIQELSRSELWTENHEKLLKLLQQSTDRKQFQNWTQRNHENFLKSIQQNTDCTHFRTGLKEIMKIFSNRSSKILIARILELDSKTHDKLFKSSRQHITDCKYFQNWTQK
jgi:hypothetical protein